MVQLQIRTNTCFVLPDPAFQNLQTLDHMALLERFTNGPVAKPFGADQGNEDLANLCGGEGGVNHLRPF